MKTDYFELLKQRPDLFINPSLKDTVTIISNPTRILEEEQRLGTEIGIIYRDEYIILLKDLVVFSDGRIGTYIRILPTIGRGGVVILPFYQDHVVLLRHFRHSNRKLCYEIPRGFSESALSEEQNAEKEVFEETGYRIKKLKYLGNIAPDTGLFATQASAYLALLDYKENNADLDSIEAIQSVELYTPQEIKNMIASGKIEDGYTLGAFALYWATEK